jgi:hypothetical protein
MEALPHSHPFTIFANRVGELAAAFRVPRITTDRRVIEQWNIAVSRELTSKFTGVRPC